MTTIDHQALINKHIQLTRIMTTLQERKGRIEMELHQYMETEEAKVILHPTHDIELKESRAYDHSKLAALRELVDPVELEGSGAFTPAHQDTVDVPEKWNMTKVKPFIKYGGEIKATIENSAYVSGVKLSIKEKLGKSLSCPLCDRPSTSGNVHVDCVDREQAMADRE